LDYKKQECSREVKELEQKRRNKLLRADDQELDDVITDKKEQLADL
jgi:hypothetical protein